MAEKARRKMSKKITNLADAGEALAEQGDEHNGVGPVGGGKRGGERLSISQLLAEIGRAGEDRRPEVTVMIESSGQCIDVYGPSLTRQLLAWLHRRRNHRDVRFRI